MKVMIFGGTHGNEWTGVMVITHYAKYFKEKYPGLDLRFLLANPYAYKANKRFQDEDLNRAFQFLKEERPSSYENRRAKEIKAMIEEEPCFVIDLHTTTSNMGSTIILCHSNPLNLHLSSELMRIHPSCKVIASPDPDRKYLAAQSHHGLMVEVGPVANGVISATALEATISILDTLLEQLQNSPVSKGGSLELYEEIQDVHYPVNEKGEISAYVHRNFQGKDFQPIKGSYTPFQSFTGEEITVEANEEVFPIFVNEAAYYPQKLAFSLCRKTTVNL